MWWFIGWFVIVIVWFVVYWIWLFQIEDYVLFVFLGVDGYYCQCWNVQVLCYVVEMFFEVDCFVVYVQMLYGRG